ncbi:hypothetical protein ABAZ39_07150 [Azospirillum argentinense]|uniref:Uncharacterized protein n=1 Tax=Azospirillum argentinense TaxID=2970906 RepID=A0A060DLU0_9PROT|nr:hypothetical protein [Azospirillum argentinense]AIB11779.1 hypothetical protein ABAZ39_07150 [Azospirillum argentinense]EZQ09753.1 hypothetical protein ABAZ39_08570 [Azospirillum argentinense]
MAFIPGLFGTDDTASTSPLLGGALPSMQDYAFSGGLQAIAPLMGPQRAPVGMGQVLASLGGGMAAGRQQGQQDSLQLASLQQKLRQQEAIRKYAEALPEAERGAFLVDPAAYIKAKNEGYTLGEGQKRYQGGQVVAEGPEKKPWEGAVKGPNGQWIMDPNYLQGRTAIAAAGRQTTNVTVNGDNALQKGLGEGIAKSIVEGRARAESALSQLSAINEARKLLDSGIISGSGAGWKLALDKGLSSIGFADGTRAANTEAFMANMGRQTLELVKGLGSGSGISNADRDYAEKVAGGSIELTEQSIRKILDINDRAARSAVRLHNTNVKPVIDDPNTPATARTYLGVPEPAAPASAPAGLQPGAVQPAARPGQKAGVPTFASPNDAAFKALPSGSEFYDPNGVLRRKP